MITVVRSGKKAYNLCSFLKNKVPSELIAPPPRSCWFCENQKIKIIQAVLNVKLLETSLLLQEVANVLGMVYDLEGSLFSVGGNHK